MRALSVRKYGATCHCGRGQAAESGSQPVWSQSIPAEVTLESVQQQLETILDSPVFAHAERLRGLLRFLVERALRDQTADLTEQQIGREVFGKPESFDPRTDPTVRVHASRLRAKLRTYYATDGVDDLLEIQLAPRCYSAVICMRPIGNTGPPPRIGARAVVRSIAVVPFVSFGKWSDRFNRGFAEELIQGLNEFPDLHLLDWHTGVPSTPKPVSVRESAGRCGIDAMLEASSRRSHNAVRVSVRLIKVQDGSVLWAHIYGGLVRDVVDLQQQIANKVAQAISLRRMEPPSDFRAAAAGGLKVPA